MSQSLICHPFTIHLTHPFNPSTKTHPLTIRFFSRPSHECRSKATALGGRVLDSALVTGAFAISGGKITRKIPWNIMKTWGFSWFSFYHLVCKSCLGGWWFYDVLCRKWITKKHSLKGKSSPVDSPPPAAQHSSASWAMASGGKPSLLLAAPGLQCIPALRWIPASMVCQANLPISGKCPKKEVVSRASMFFMVFMA